MQYTPKNGWFPNNDIKTSSRGVPSPLPLHPLLPLTACWYFSTGLLISELEHMGTCWSISLSSSFEARKRSTVSRTYLENRKRFSFFGFPFLFISRGHRSGGSTHLDTSYTFIPPNDLCLYCLLSYESYGNYIAILHHIQISHFLHLRIVSFYFIVIQEKMFLMHMHANQIHTQQST